MSDSESIDIDSGEESEVGGLLVVCRMKLGVNLIDQGDVHQAIISRGHIVSTEI